MARPISMTFKIKDSPKKWNANFRQKARHTKPLMKAVGAEMATALRGEGVYKTGIAQQKQPNSTKFKALKKSTKEIRKIRKITSTKILLESGSQLLGNIRFWYAHLQAQAGVDPAPITNRPRKSGGFNANRLAKWHETDLRVKTVFGNPISPDKGHKPARVIHQFSVLLAKNVTQMIYDWFTFDGERYVTRKRR